MECLKCASSDFTSLRLLYEGGLSQINTKTSGVGVGLGRGGLGVGIGGGNTKGVSQTVESAKAAPPSKAKYRYVVLLFFAVLFGTSFLLANLTGSMQYLGDIVILSIICGFTFFLYKKFQFNRKKWPVLMTEWENTYKCNRCGNFFVAE